MSIGWFAVEVKDFGFDAAWLLSWLGFQLVGTDLVARRPENRLSWVGRLRNQVDPRHVSEEFGHAVQRTVQPASLVLWVRAPVGTAGPGR